MADTIDPPPRRALFAALVARLLLEEVAAGRWVKLADGRLVPVDTLADNVIQWPHTVEETAHAQAQDTAAGSGSR